MQQGPSSILAKRAAEISFFAMLGLIAIAIAEGGYRFYLRHAFYAELKAKVEDDSAPTFGFYAYPAPWRFDHEQGFVFNDGSWLSGIVLNGTFDKCEVRGRGNRYGNFGEVRGDYRQAQVKIALFGSSYTLIDHNLNGDTATNLLQENLARHLDKTVHVLNYSRDATGILNMFDIAKVRLPVDRPDIAVFTFNTTAFGYQRSWRVVAESRPGYFRMYQTLDPTDELAPHRSILNAHIISRHITKEWCNKMAAALQRGDTEAIRNDPIVIELKREHNDIKRAQTTPRVALSFLNLRTSFIYNQLAHGNPYRGLQVYEPKTIYSPLQIDTYNEDTKLLEAIAAVKALGIPFLLVHLPTLNDFRNPESIVFGAHGVPAERERLLLKSLQALTAAEIVRLIEFYNPNHLGDPLALVMSEQDSHPSPKGVPAMADALYRLLLETRILGN